MGQYPWSWYAEVLVTDDILTKFIWQVLLASPNLNNAINMEAIEMMSQSPHTYRQMVVECVTASQRIDGDYFLWVGSPATGSATHSSD